MFLQRATSCKPHQNSFSSDTLLLSIDENGALDNSFLLGVFYLVHRAPPYEAYVRFMT